MSDITIDQLRRELDATRRMAAGAADDLDRERRAHQDALDAGAAAELKLLTTAVDLGERLVTVERERDAAQAQVERLTALINTPRTDEFFESVRIEAAHQVDRWGSEHDAGKDHAAWHSLVSTHRARWDRPMTGPDVYQLFAATQGVPEGWRWCSLNAVGERGVVIKGAVCAETITGGPRKGEPNWKKLDRATVRELFVTFAQLDEIKLKWEVETGKCSECGGDGQQVAVVSVRTGTTYRPCTRCKTAAQSGVTP